MTDIPDESVDMILADLPYGKTRAEWDVPLDMEKLWEQYSRVAKQRAAIVLTATEPFASKLVMSNLHCFHYDLIWHKNRAQGHLNANHMPLRAHENILVFGKTQPNYFPLKTGGHRPVSRYRRYPNRGKVYGQTYGDGELMGGQTDRFPRSVLEFSVVNNDSPERIHPNQKPLDLWKWLVKSFSRSGEIVLDSCVGSGTTAVAAYETGRQFIVIELDKTFYYQACQRVLASTRKPEQLSVGEVDELSEVQ